MQDMTCAAPIPAWQTNLRRGDVVAFRFPCAEDAGAADPKARTCLVLEIETRDGRHFAELAYGTTSDSHANRGEDLPVVDLAEIAAAGLRRPTRFVCARRVVVCVDHPAWEVSRRYATPVIGHLAPRSYERMNAIRARLHALRDFAADRRRERARMRQAAPRTRADFIVEHRRRRPVRRSAAEAGS